MTEEKMIQLIEALKGSRIAKAWYEYLIWRGDIKPDEDEGANVVSDGSGNEQQSNRCADAPRLPEP